MFEVEEHGRTVLKNVENVCFSLSHAGDYALCCISDCMIGADMECSSKLIFQEAKSKNLQMMAQKVFSTSEYERFEKSDEQTRVQLFLKYWTRKESYSKAFGEGLRMDFSKIDTEEMQDLFWSDWLEEDCFVSIYMGESSSKEIAFYKISNLKI